MSDAAANAVSYGMRGTPGAGVRIVPPGELVDRYLGDSRLRAAIDLTGRVEGAPKWPQVAMRQAMTKHVRHLDMHAEEQKKAIDLQRKKLQGGKNVRKSVFSGVSDGSGGFLKG